MSEYWKSLPRKFCDICKCWFADNKASIEFHERGKRHQENAQKRIQDIQKRGIKDFKKQKKLEDDMAKIEKAALAAYKKDLQNNAEAITSSVPSALIQSNNLPEIPPKKQKTAVHPKKAKKESPKIKQEPPEEVATKVWYEALTDEGHKYYWNTVDSESQWEPPAEGFVSLEQAAQNRETTVEIKIKIEETSEEKDSVSVKEEKEEEERSKTPPSNIGPQPRYDPYGQWVTIEKREPVKIDLQLPKPSEDVVQIVIPIAKDEPRLKIREKVISHLVGTDPTEEVTFKKRKFTGSSKRNARQRTNDDD